MAPVAEPHSDTVSANSPFTPALIAIDGNVPHFGLIVAGSIGQLLFGEASVQANLKLIIFNIFPQV